MFANVIGNSIETRLERKVAFVKKHPVPAIIIFYFLIWPFLREATWRNFEHDPRHVYIYDAETKRPIPDVMVAAQWRGQFNEFRLHGSSVFSMDIGRALEKSDALGRVNFGYGTWVKIFHNLWATTVSRRVYPMKLGYLDVTPFDGVDAKLYGFPQNARVYLMARDTAATVADHLSACIKNSRNWEWYCNELASHNLRALMPTERLFQDHLRSDACSFNEVRDFYFQRVKPIEDFYAEKERRRRSEPFAPGLVYGGPIADTFPLTKCNWTQ